MPNFEFTTTKRIVCEIGGLANLTDYCTKLRISKLFIVTDKGIVNLGLLDELLASMSGAGISVQVFDGVLADPPQSVVVAAAESAISCGANGVIGFGGGSSMDCAKLVAVLAKQQQALASMYGVDKVTSQRLPLILVPTTAGTGSEVTPISIVTTGETTKAGIVSSVLLPDIALLDASLTLGLGPNITAATGIDAMVHAIEAYTSKHKKNAYSDMLAKQALHLLSANIEKATHNGSDVDARQNMMLGACLAGQAFANAPVAAVHALAYPLGGHFHISHGLSNALVLPHVLRFNGNQANDLYGQLLPFFKSDLMSTTDADASENLATYFLKLSQNLGLPTTLQAMDIHKDNLPMLAQDAMQQTRLLVNNPRSVSYEDALNIYQKAY